MADVIKLSGKKKTSTSSGWASISSQLEKLKTLPKAVQIIASPKTTLALGATLGGLLAAPAGAGLGGVVSSQSIKGAVKGGLATGTGLTVGALLATSPTARKLAKEKVVNPTGFGEKVGGLIEKTKSKASDIISKTKDIIEKPSEIIDKAKSKIPSAVKTAGAVAGVTALGAGALALAPKAVAGAKSLFPSKATSVATSPVTEPIFSYVPGAITQAETIEQAPVSTGKNGVGKPINIKNTININNQSGVKQTKKYINQMNYIKVRRRKR